MYDGLLSFVPLCVLISSWYLTSAVKMTASVMCSFEICYVQYGTLKASIHQRIKISVDCHLCTLTDWILHVLKFLLLQQLKLTQLAKPGKAMVLL